MATSKSKDKSKTEKGEEKSFVIKEALIKEELCNYKFEIISGIHIGDTHNVTGKGLIKDDMRTAFSKLNVHLAVIDDVFKHSKIDIVNIDDMNSHELTGLYEVSGFKIKGSDKDESVILIGQKHVTEAGGWMDLISPKIVMDNLSSYHWAEDLKEAVNEARKEVELYKGGKCTPVEKEEPAENSKQLTIGHQAEGTDANEVDKDFENAKV